MNAALESLPPLRDVIEAHNLRAEKKFGQNFILDANVTDKIARAAGDLSKHTVIEIGPGPGGLTRSLLRAGARQVVAIEFDPRAILALSDLEKAAQGRLKIVQGDALSSNLLELTPQGPRMIVANLPYNIASVLLIGWLKQIRSDVSFVDKMVLMFQKEVGDRIIAAPATKPYGRLSVMTQWLCGAKRLFDLPPSVFVPAPKVISSVIEITPARLESDSPDFEAMEKIVGAAFGQRRKMLRSSLKSYPGLLQQARIDETLRAETLPVADFVKLASLL